MIRKRFWKSKRENFIWIIHINHQQTAVLQQQHPDIKAQPRNLYQLQQSLLLRRNIKLIFHHEKQKGNLTKRIRKLKKYLKLMKNPQHLLIKEVKLRPKGRKKKVHQKKHVKFRKRWKRNLSYRRQLNKNKKKKC